MSSTQTVLPYQQNTVRRHRDEDLTTFYAFELFMIVVIVDAVLMFVAPAIPDIASLYATVT